MNLTRRLIEIMFIDGDYLHRYWRCHRYPERSFSFGGRQFHVCARCTGIILGFYFGVLLLPFVNLLAAEARILFYLSTLAIAIDGGTQYLRLRESNNGLRFVSGLWFGASLPSFILILLVASLKKAFGG